MHPVMTSEDVVAMPGEAEQVNPQQAGLHPLAKELSATRLKRGSNALFILAALYVFRLLHAAVWVMPGDRIDEILSPDQFIPAVAICGGWVVAAIWAAVGMRRAKRITIAAGLVAAQIIAWLVWLGIVLTQHHPFTPLTYIVEFSYIVWIIITLCLICPLVR